MRARVARRIHPPRLRLRLQRPRIVLPAKRSLKVVALVTGLVAVLAVALFVGGTAASMLYGQYGLHPERDARIWAGFDLVFAGSTDCAACHASEATTLTSSRHAGVPCESCHGAKGDHVAVESAKAAAASTTGGTTGSTTGSLTGADTTTGAPVTADLALDSSGRVCVTCHERVLGRPAAIAQEDLAVHYGIGSCLRCHDAHSTQVMRPPAVVHPLTNLPECRVCHGSQGLNPAPVGHVDSDDKACLGCHAPGSGDR